MHQVDSPKSLVLHWCRLFPSRWCRILVCTRVLQLRRFKMSFLQSDNNTVMIAQQLLLWAKAVPAESWVPCALRGSPAGSGRKKKKRQEPAQSVSDPVYSRNIACATSGRFIHFFFQDNNQWPPMLCVPTFPSNFHAQTYITKNQHFFFCLAVLLTGIVPVFKDVLHLLTTMKSAANNYVVTDLQCL